MPDALSRMYEDEIDYELASRDRLGIEIAEETSDAWYKDRWYASVAANPNDHPY